MTWRNRAEIAAAIVAFALCGAFLASFVFGLRSDAQPPQIRTADPHIIPIPDRDAGKVEVLNASGRSGAARNATDHLRSGGFDVVYFGNDVGRDSSVVFARIANDGVARAAARRLGIAQVRSEPDSTLFLDATVVLGKDWQEQGDAPNSERKGWVRRNLRR